jgi:hypothetical protein
MTFSGNKLDARKTLGQVESRRSKELKRAEERGRTGLGSIERKKVS